MLKGFTEDGKKLQNEVIVDRIKQDLIQRRERKVMEQALAGEERKAEELGPIELGELEDQRRNFAEKLRPDRKIWNFFAESEESKLAHVLRANANPTASYIDNRVSDLLIVIEGMGQHLRVHNN